MRWMDAALRWLHKSGATKEIMFEDFGTFFAFTALSACDFAEEDTANRGVEFSGLALERFGQAIAERRAEFGLPLRVAEEGIVERLAIVQDHFLVPSLELQ